MQVFLIFIVMEWHPLRHKIGRAFMRSVWRVALPLIKAELN